MHDSPMRVIETLIRSSRRRLENERRLLAGLVALNACLCADAERLSEGIAEEEGAGERRERLLRSIAEVEGQIRRARSAVGEAFAELERHELAASSRARRAQRLQSLPLSASLPSR